MPFRISGSLSPSPGDNLTHLPVVSTQSYDPSSFRTKKTGNPHGDMLGQLEPFPANSASCFLDSNISTGSIWYGLQIRSCTKFSFHSSKSTLLRDGNGMIPQFICNSRPIGMFPTIELFPLPSWCNTRRHHQLCNQFRCTYHTGHYI